MLSPGRDHSVWKPLFWALDWQFREEPAGHRTSVAASSQLRGSGGGKQCPQTRGPRCRRFQGTGRDRPSSLLLLGATRARRQLRDPVGCTPGHRSRRQGGAVLPQAGRESNHGRSRATPSACVDGPPAEGVTRGRTFRSLSAAEEASLGHADPGDKMRCWRVAGPELQPARFSEQSVRTEERGLAWKPAGGHDW